MVGTMGCQVLAMVLAFLALGQVQAMEGTTERMPVGCSPFSEFNLLVLGDVLLNSTDVMGSVAVCGNAKLLGGVAISSRGGKCKKGVASLYVQGSLDTSKGSGVVLGPGSAIFNPRGAGKNLGKGFYVACGKKRRAGQVKCKSLAADALSTNGRFCRQPNTGKFTLKYGTVGVLSAKKASTGTVYISVPSVKFAKVRSWDQEGLSGRAVVVNVRGKTVKFGKSSMGILQSIENSLIWNFCGVRKIDHTMGAHVVGGILAPRASYVGANNAIDGPVVVGAFEGSTEIHDIGAVSAC